MFSSHDIDTGSRLLLQAVRRHLPDAAFDSILDMGCGVGVLGLGLKQHYPSVNLYLSDRDALALGFSRLNAELNHLEPVRWGGHLGFSGLEWESFDLIVSNLPAKAGPPVLRHFLDTYSSCLRPEGLFVLVIVNTLAELAASCLKEIVFQERGREHTVICCRRQAADAQEGLTPYIRGRYQFSARGRGYHLDTVYNLPCFDTLGYETAMMFALLEGAPPTGRTLVWNPGQGHVPAYLAAERAGTPSFSLVLGSRDLLQLAISTRNLGSEQAERRHLPAPGWLEDVFDNLIVFPNPERGALELLARTCPDLLQNGGRLYLVAPSTQIQRFLAALRAPRALRDRKPLRLLRSKKTRGLRGLVLSRE